ncbi:MAG TPA: dihydrodipicolinate synthase family protein [bacterium]|jgi:4-hydroxy-tetrahydrodipicolinate synthase|nr:dihydrodipicolinate synthase family protein [bacterium]
MDLGDWLPHDYARVHQAASESEAMFVQRILEEAGIPAILRSRQVPGYGEIIRGAFGYWGDVLVAVDDRERAEQHVATYLRVMKGASAVAHFSGIIPPLVTLFDEDGGIDTEANERHIDFVIDGGAHGVFAMGSNGEAMHLTTEERRSFVELVVQRANSRVPVLVGCASTSTDEAVGYARHAQDAGADGVVVIPPYYWAPNDAAIETHIGAVARAVDLPVIIYNFPAVVGRNIPTALVAKLAAAYANVLGIKETIDSISHIQDVIERVKPVKPEFSVLCGNEFHLLNTLLSGGDGAIPAIANFAPQLPVEVYERFRQGRLEEAAASMRRRLGLAELYQLDAPFFVVVKEAMVMLGLLPLAIVRRPAGPLTDANRARLRQMLTSAGLL